MLKSCKCFILFALVSILACAHKATPLSKDRMKPKLQKVSALNNRQIQFTFSETLDTLNLKPEHFTITGGADTLDIITLYPSLSAAEIIALTSMQTNEIYNASGYMFDTAQNKGNFEISFIGSATPDTIAPWIVHYSKGANHKEFSLKFSEAMDTTFLKFHILPKKNLVQNWQNYRLCLLTSKDPADSLKFDTTYYLYVVDQGAFDVSGNGIGPFSTSITPDTIYRPINIQGKVQISDTLIRKGIAILKRETPMGITLVKDGHFMFEVRDSLKYIVEVISGKYSGSTEVSAADSIIIINLQLEEKNIDSFFN